MDKFIEGVIATCDHVGAKRHSRRKLQLSFDEWNLLHEGRYTGPSQPAWTRGPRMVEDDYTVEDAVVVGNLLMSLLRHSDRVTAASQAQLVNLMAPIRAEPDGAAWRQTIFYPFALTARHARGEVLRVEPTGPMLHSATLGAVAAVDVTATYDDTGEVTVFAVNRGESEPAELQLLLNGVDAEAVPEHVIMGGTNLSATNTKNDPDRVAPRASDEHILDGNRLSVTLPPVSWSMIRTRPTA